MRTQHDPITLPISIFKLNKRDPDAHSASAEVAEKPLDIEAKPAPETPSESETSANFPSDEMREDERPAEREEGVAPVETPPEPHPPASTDPVEDILAISEVPLSSEQLEAALERLIEQQFGEGSDHLLTAVIEKAVARRIDRFKRLLTDFQT